MQVISSKKSVVLNLKKRLDRHSVLLRLIKNSLPESLAVNCCGCCLNQSTLIIYSRSATWVSQLRFYKPELKQSLNEKTSEFHISEIIFRVLVTPEGLTAENSQPQPISPSNNTIDEIQDSARFITDKKLSQSIENLALTLRRHKR